MEGTHRPEGVFIATGPGIAKGVTTDCHIVDCTPTILAALGVRIPDDMEGQVVTAAFEQPPTVESEAAEPAAIESDDGEVYSDVDLERITERLSDLGYLE